jgi:archaellum biogenesis ATPase FlaH
MKLTEMLLARAYVSRNERGEKTVSFKDKWQSEARKLSEQEIVSHLHEPNGAIAMLTGKENGITVLDFDDMGSQLLIELAEVCPTYCVQTYKGVHFYYRYTPELQTGSNRFGEGVDVRNDGGVVFCPPTPHYQRWGEEIITELNAEAKELLNKYSTHTKKETNLVTTTSRNDTLFRKACGWANHYPDQEVWNRMVKANRDFQKGELDDRELEIMYQQVLKYKKTGSVEDIKPDETTERDFKSEKRFTWGTQNLNYNFSIIRETNFIVIGAKRSSGKTLFSFHMAKANALKGHKVLYLSLEMETSDILDDIGRKFSGMPLKDEYEQDISEEKMKLYRKKIQEIQSIENLNIVGIRRETEPTWEKIKELLDKHNVDIMFIDNLDCIKLEKEQNENLRQAKVTRAMMSYTSERKIPIILIHHYRKSGKEDFGMDELAGSGKIADNADRIVTLKRAGTIQDPYPQKYETEISLVKGRGYPENTQSIYFIKGSFVDNPPALSEEQIIQQGVTEEDTRSIFDEFIDS